MRLPYLQLAEKFITVQSKVVARMLGIKRHTAIGMGALLFESVLELTSTDEAPPSGIIAGDDAADIIEAGMEWDGERGKAFGAFVRADVIERLESGARVKGCDRYATAWQKQQKRRSAAKAGAEARWGAASCLSAMPSECESDSNRIETASPSDAPRNAQTETEIQIHTEKKKQPLQAVGMKPPEPEELRPDAEGNYQPTAWGFWGWHDDERDRRSLFREERPPDDFLSWYAKAVKRVGVAGLARAYPRFLEDAAFGGPKGWAFHIFASENVYFSRANPDPPRKVRL